MAKSLSDITKKKKNQTLVIKEKRKSTVKQHTKKRLLKVDLSGVIYARPKFVRARKLFDSLWINLRKITELIEQLLGPIFKLVQTPLIPKRKPQPPRVPIKSFYERGVIRRTAPMSEAKRTVFSLGFGLLLVLIIISGAATYERGKVLQKRVLDNSYIGYQYLDQATDAMTKVNTVEAAKDFKLASESFTFAKTELERINKGISFVYGSPLDTGTHLLAAGENLSLAGASFANVANIIGETQNIKLAIFELKLALDYLETANRNLQEVNIKSLPPEYQDTITRAKNELPTVISKIEEFIQLEPVILDIFGEPLIRRYLIIFQNTAEARATGGFIGGFAIMDFYKGNIVNFETKDIYTVSWQLWENVPAPSGLEQYMENVQMQDSNYLPDMASASYWINWFYEHSNQTSVDGVIAIDETLLEQLLDIIGPIELPEYNYTLNSKNAFEILEYQIEISKNHPVTPKQILMDTIEQIQNKIMEVKPWPELAKLILEEIKSKHIQVHLFNEDAQAIVEQFNADGNVLPINDKQDYLLIADTNTGGNKSDRYMRDDISHETFVTEDGTITNTVTYKLKHTWNKTALEKLYENVPKLKLESESEKNRITYILGAGENKSFVRIYVPPGSELIETTGIPIEEVLTKSELERTVYGFTVTTQPGNETELSIKYILPYKLDTELTDAYVLKVQKQSGRDHIQFSKSITIDSALKFTGSYADNQDQNQSTITYEEPLTGNLYFTQIIGK